MTTDAQQFDELATEIEDILKSPEAGKIIADDLLNTCQKKIKTIMGGSVSPPEVRACIQREINAAIKNVLPDDVEWNDSVRSELFQRQINTIDLLRANENVLPEAMTELAYFLREFVVGFETFRAKLLRK